MSKEQGKLFSMRMTPEEDRCLTERAALTHMSKAAVLKQSLNPIPIFGEALIYEAMKKIDQHLKESDTEAVREEMRTLCISLNSLTRKTENNMMTNKE